MSKLFVGKFTIQEQYDNNYFRITNKKDTNQFNGLEIGDYVLPSHGGYVGKLLKLRAYVDKSLGLDAEFDVVKTFDDTLTIANIVNCGYFIPDMNLLYKVHKSTKGIGFHEISYVPGSPNIEDIDLRVAQRRYLIVTKEKMKNTAFFKPHDICVVLDNKEQMNIDSIVEFDGQQFKVEETLSAIYKEKIGKNEKYSILELYKFAKPEHDNAPKKFSFLTKVIDAISTEEYIVINYGVKLYDMIIVGRKQVKKGGVETISEENDDEGFDHYDVYAKLLKFNPNLILYGPPGTGKTYGAMRIIEAFEAMNGTTTSFKNVSKEGRAKFITFHQAFSYEEFVEGLRPETDDKGNIRYEVKPGVLRKIAEECRVEQSKKLIKNDELSQTTSESKVWKVSLGRRNTEEHIYSSLKAKNAIAIGYGINENMTDYSDEEIDNLDKTGMLKVLHSKMQIGDIVLVFNSIKTIRLIGVVVSDYYYDDQDSFGYRHRRQVKWLKNCEKEPIDIYKLNNNKQLTLSSLYELKISSADALNLLDSTEAINSVAKPYYLVIDEINRGNIAKIFGELITLIEKDKRDVISCTLPYSGQDFTLPDNLYIIGTMNTSDRSIALLDTALRRRFAFVELNPDIDLIEKTLPTIGGNVNPSKLLSTINEKIALELDRDHRIGHSYLMGDDMLTKSDLFYVWYYKIIPLLMEYFYNDTDKVSSIIGNQFFNKYKKEVVMLGNKADEVGVSDFERALMSIYETGNK